MTGREPYRFKNAPRLSIVAISGRFGRPHSDFIKVLHRCNATHSAKITSMTDYLLAADVTGSTAKRAAAMGIKVLSEAEFDHMAASDGFPTR